MTTGKIDYNLEVYILNSNNEIEDMTYGQFLNRFYSEQVTSPRGVVPSYFVQSMYDGTKYTYEVEQWMPNGSSWVKGTFNTEEEAENNIMERWEDNYNGGRISNESCYFEKSEAQTVLAERNA